MANLPLSNNRSENTGEIEQLISKLLVLIGEDPNREGLIGTPNRVARMFGEIFRGYDKNIESVVHDALYDTKGSKDMILVDNISYNSFCEHHMLPFSGKVNVAYIPRNKIIGLSKIPRIIDMFSQRLQVQERLTKQIANSISDILNPLGVAVFITGTHSCASIRGVKKAGVVMKTIEYSGVFKENMRLRNEFLQMITMGL